MTHGLTLTESTQGGRAVQPRASNIIGLVATASAAAGAATTALNTAFPLNTPVLVTDVLDALGKAGTGGTLKPALDAIGDIASPIIIVVRVGIDVDEADQNLLVIGATTDNVYTGIKAMLTAEAAVGVRPRIIIAPGLDTQPVATELAITAQKLRGRAFARAIGADQAAAILYRANFAQRELSLIWPNFTGGFAGDAVARAAAIRARIDEEIGFHKTISNVALNGPEGIDKNVSWSLTDPSTAAGLLNDNDIVTLIRRDGFRFWGNTTCSDVDEYRFESSVNTVHAIGDLIDAVMLPFMDQPMNKGLIKAFLDTINARLRRWVQEGRLIGGEVSFRQEDNVQTDLAQGRPVFHLEFTDTAPLNNPNVRLVITDKYYAGFADLLN